MIESIYANTQADVLHRLWIISDLQQSVAENATRCMVRAVRDIRSIGYEPEAVCYLGDGVEGNNLPHLEAMTSMQIEQLELLSCPVYYVCGNHDSDYLERTRPDRPVRHLADAVSIHDGWHTAPLDYPFLRWSIGNVTFIMLSDHYDPDMCWHTRHGRVIGDRSKYPYDESWYQALSRDIARIPGPVITMSHYAFPGGQRSEPSDLHNAMLPLPSNVRLHLYGHAHIGDHGWAGPNLYRRISTIEEHDINQVNVSALEDNRGSGSRSVLMNIYTDGSVGLFFRNHSLSVWEDYFLLDKLLS